MSKPVTLTTAWIFDDGTIRKAASTSQQLPEDPFSYSGDAGEAGLQIPPLDLDGLAGMLETNSLHYRAVQTKANDVAGRGFTLRANAEDTNSDQATAAWAAFVESVEEDDRGGESFKERIVAAHSDYESTGLGILEASRNLAGLPDGLWHVPGHTVRAHKDGRRFAQRRAGKFTWFKRYGLPGDVDRKGGGWSDTPLPADIRGNELIVVRNYTPRSSFYGLPDHVPALAALAGWRAQAEFNVRFFDNNAVPSYAVIIEGADISPKLEEDIRGYFRQIKGDPHRTLILPVPGFNGDSAGEVKVRFEKLAVDIKDASFRLYKADNALEICIAHGVPPYRVGWPLLGSLGGATAAEMTQIYNDSIVQPRQETWEQRLTRALLGVKGLGIAGHVLKAAELDQRNESADLQKSLDLFTVDAITPNEIRAFYGYPKRLDPDGDLFKSQIAGLQPGPVAPIAEQIMKRDAWMAEVRELAALRKRLEVVLQPSLVAA